MISVYYLCVCVSLLYCVDLSQTLSLNYITAKNQYEMLTKSVNPYGCLAYDIQLKKKQNRTNGIVRKIVELCDSLENPMKYKVRPIIPSPVIKAYRNRDLFSIKPGVDGNIKTVGCAVRNSRHLWPICIHPTTVQTIKESHKRVAQVYEDFIRLSPLLPYDESNDNGHWGPILVRSNEAGDHMVAVTVQRRGYTFKMIEKQQQALKDYFLKHLPNITLFHQECSLKAFVLCTNDVAPYLLLYGTPYLVEILNGYKFLITPASYFQINKMSAEVLYNATIRMAKLTPRTTLLDICSGTGAISILASKFVRDSVGIEANMEAVRVARNCAKFNNIYNVYFMLGTVEETLKTVLERCEGPNEVVAIMHPGSRGLDLEVIRTIKTCSQISRVIYISCKPGNPNSMRNIAELCSKESSNLPLFRLTEAIPVDTHPLTNHYELILMFQRSPLPKQLK